MYKASKERGERQIPVWHDEDIMMNIMRSINMSVKMSIMMSVTMRVMTRVKMMLDEKPEEYHNECNDDRYCELNILLLFRAGSDKDVGRPYFLHKIGPLLMNGAHQHLHADVCTAIHFKASAPVPPST